MTSRIFGAFSPPYVPLLCLKAYVCHRREKRTVEVPVVVVQVGDEMGSTISFMGQDL